MEMGNETWQRQARERSDRGIYGGDEDALDRVDAQLDAVEADLALARGHALHGRYLVERVEDPREIACFERAVELYAGLGDVRGEGEARFWLGTVHHVIREDADAALPLFERALELSTQAGDSLTLYEVERHLGFVDLGEGRVDEAREHLRESLRLVREAGFAPGVAAALLTLARLEADAGNTATAAPLLAEAIETAQASGADRFLVAAQELQARV